MIRTLLILSAVMALSLADHFVNSKNEEALVTLNSMRDRFALIAQIPKMMELTYSKELEKEAEKYNCESLNNRRNKNLAVYWLIDEQVSFDFFNYATQHRNETNELKNYFGQEDHYAVLFAPMLTKAGCHLFSEPCPKPFDLYMNKYTNVKEININGLCLLGPKSPRFERIVNAGAASQCQKRRENTVLCLN